MHAFRQATPSDAEALATLVNSAYRGDSSKVGWTTEADLLGGQRTDKNGILEMMSTGTFEIVVDESSHLLGCVYLQAQREGLYLGMLTVQPTLQARGTGKALLLRAEDFAREKGLNRIYMTVIGSRTELIAFYERRGYRASGEVREFPRDPVFGIPKVDNIVLKVFEKFL